MNAQILFKLAKINSDLERKGYIKESDRLCNTILRTAANWQSPYVDIPMLERAWPFRMVEEDFE